MTLGGILTGIFGSHNVDLTVNVMIRRICYKDFSNYYEKLCN